MDTTELIERTVARADNEGLVDVAWTAYDSPVGPLVLAATLAGLVTISYEDEDHVLTLLATKISPRVIFMTKRLDDVRSQLDAYFAGRLHAFELPLDWSLATAFQRTVLHEVEHVRYGTVATYADIARAIGRPSASRATGGANARNPLPIVVPCHRIIGSDGSLTGYGGGMDAKAFLLDLEGWQ
jgi:methylated-DNA-[protein]-cysteine S-methyltransferase